MARVTTVLHCNLRLVGDHPNDLLAVLDYHVVISSNILITGDLCIPIISPKVVVTQA